MKHFMIIASAPSTAEGNNVEIRVYSILRNVPSIITKMSVNTNMRSVNLGVVHALAMLGYVPKAYLECTYYRNDNPHFRIHTVGSEEV
jgi:hypothetical protein